MAGLPAVPVTATSMPEWVRRAGSTINNLITQMGKYARLSDFDDLKTLVTTKSGWANYADTTGTQMLSSGVRTQWTNNAGSVDDAEKPSDVTTFWDATANTVTGRNGDALAIRFQMVFTPSDSTASSLLVEVDIGGSVGLVDALMFPVTGGASMPQHISWNVLAFQRATWAANGAKVYVTADGPGALTAKRILVARMHRANASA